jgi:hypothetical protein
MTVDHVPENQRRVVEALRSGGPAAPESLRRRIEALEAEHERTSRFGSLGDRATRPRLRTRPLAFAAGIGAVLAIALVVALSLGGPGGPSVVEAAELGELPATAAAPDRDPGRPALLDASFAGVTFPDWSEEFGWRTNGARSDELGGRETETVFYTHEGHRIGYTVIDGEPLDPPKGARTVKVGGLTVHMFRDGERDVVTFERNGRTCVISGHVLERETLLELAAWKGAGAVTF